MSELRNSNALEEARRGVGSKEPRSGGGSRDRTICRTVRNLPQSSSPGTDSLSHRPPPGQDEDVTQYLIRFASGALGTIGSSRVGIGRKLGLDYEIQGTKGARSASRRSG
jgi:predicted dehydrogenase